MVCQAATLDTTEPGKGGVVLVAVGGHRCTVFKINDEPAVGVAGAAHDVLLFFGHITPLSVVFITSITTSDSSLFFVSCAAFAWAIKKATLAWPLQSRSGQNRLELVSYSDTPLAARYQFLPGKSASVEGARYTTITVSDVSSVHHQLGGAIAYRVKEGCRQIQLRV